MLCSNRCGADAGGWTGSILATAIFTAAISQPTVFLFEHELHDEFGGQGDLHRLLETRSHCWNVDAGQRSGFFRKLRGRRLGGRHIRSWCVRRILVRHIGIGNIDLRSIDPGSLYVNVVDRSRGGNVWREFQGDAEPDREAQR